MDLEEMGAAAKDALPDLRAHLKDRDRNRDMFRLACCKPLPAGR
jgi:hypothetical protein